MQGAECQSVNGIQGAEILCQVQGSEPKTHSSPRLDSFGGRQRVDYKYWLFSALKCASKTMRWDYAKLVAERGCFSCVCGEF